MKPDQETFGGAWISFDLGDYRPCDSTYCGSALESLPPLKEPLDGSFGWLAAKLPKPTPKAEKAMKALAEKVKAAGHTLPPEFVTFFSRPGLGLSIPSCTACEWDVSKEPIANPAQPGAHTLRFLRDQQDCCFWYLYFPPTGAPYVINSPIPFDDPEVMRTGTEGGGPIDADIVKANTCRSADSLEAFIYRYWLENTLWDKLHASKPKPFTLAEQAYLDHYAAQKAQKALRT